MEALGVASGVAGLVSLAGQVIAVVIAFSGFFKDFKHASRTVGRFYEDLNNLIRTLEDVKEICNRVSYSDVSNDDYFSVQSLKILLEACHGDICKWLQIAQAHYVGTSGSPKSLLKRFAIAAEKRGITNVQERIRGLSKCIAHSLTVIGRLISYSIICFMVCHSNFVQEL